MRSYFFKFPKTNGHTDACNCLECHETKQGGQNLTFEQAYLLANSKPELKDLIDQRIREIIANSKAKRRVKDGFEPGWQENIQAYAGGRREYDQLLKEKGLQEIGYDYIPKDSTVCSSPCHTEEFALAVKEVFPDTSDNEVEAIKDGSYFENTDTGITSKD